MTCPYCNGTGREPRGMANYANRTRPCRCTRSIWPWVVGIVALLLGLAPAIWTGWKP
jgi:hypothetical protein